MELTVIRSKHRLDSTAAQVIFVVVFLGLLLIHRYVFIGMYVLLCLWTLMGPKQAIKALSLNYLMLLLNPAIYSVPPETSLLRWIILFVAGLRVVPFISFRVLGYVSSLLLFFLTVTVLAYITSPAFPISFFKITAFTYGAATFLIAFSALDENKLEELKKWFLAISIAVVLLSLPTLLIRRIGFHTNGNGFQGILNQPQAFGTFLAPTVAYLAANIFITRQSKDLWQRVLAGISACLMFVSRCRTGILALLLSLGTALAAATLSPHRKNMQMAPSRTVFYLAFGLIGLFALIAASSSFSTTVDRFWVKGEETMTIEEAFNRSRGAGIAFHWNRFLQEPLTGHGFGIDVAHGVGKGTKSFLGIPLSSPTEKGFLPVAFLEEVGLIGLLCFIPIFLLLFKNALGQWDVGLMAMFFACLFVNVGEAVFFSPGYLGGYLWLLIGLSTAPGWKRNQMSGSR